VARPLAARPAPAGFFPWTPGPATRPRREAVGGPGVRCFWANDPTHIQLGALDAAVARLSAAIDVTERNRGGGGLTIICSAGRQLRRWRDSAEVQDVYDRIMALMAA